jgi:hypothetical protein
MVIQEMNPIVLLVVIYNLVLLIGTTYLIVFYDWSVLWYIFTYLFLLDLRGHDD